MFDKTMVRLLLAAALAATLFGGTAMAGFTPPTGLAPGSKYQLAFVTDGTTDATSGLESYYNNFAQEQATPLTTILPTGTTWSAITSTSTDYFGGHVDARVNAPTFAGVPIYNTQGQLVATGSGLWSGQLQNPIEYDPTGGYEGGVVWTGSKSDGTANIDGDLGFQSFPWLIVGDSAASNSYWLYFGQYSPSIHFPIYALSSPITVVPEPATLTLLGPGTAGTWSALSAAAQDEDDGTTLVGGGPGGCGRVGPGRTCSTCPADRRASNLSVSAIRAMWRIRSSKTTQREGTAQFPTSIK